MEFFTTYIGEDFRPLDPEADKIHIGDIAHALSLMCRANGHIKYFFSVAQHSLNCAAEAKASGLSAKIQLACLLHDASEAYLSDITRPVKGYLPKYMEVEKCLQQMIYGKYLNAPLTAEEQEQIAQVDTAMLMWEFSVMMTKTIFNDLPEIISKPDFMFRRFSEVENEFLQLFKTLSRVANHFTLNH